MKRKLLLALFAIISLGCFADSQPTDADRKANLFVNNGMLFSIQHFGGIHSQDNTVEFCGWTTKTDLSTDAKKDEALTDAQFNAIRKAGEITIPGTVTAAVTYGGVLQGNATYKVIMLRANLFRAASSGVTSLITKITIPKTVEHIESRCFDECVNMTEFVIEGATDGTSQLKEIDSHAFLNCKKLASITLPNSVTYLGENDPTSSDGGVFEGCESLTSFTFPSSYASRNLPSFTFKNCKNLATINWNGYSPKRLNSCAFWNCDKITWSQVPQSVEELGDECFYHCAALTSVDLSKIKKMDTGVFWGTPLTSVEWPAAVTEIPARTFFSCGQLTTIKGISGQLGAWDNITKIGEDAFNECKALTTIKLPNSLKTLDKQAFRSCWNLKNVEYSNQLETIGEGAFQDNLFGFEKFYFKGSVKNVGSYAFANGKLTCVHLKGDMTMGDYVFQNDKSLKYVEFPATSSATQPLTKVTEGMFQNCTSLPFITLPSTVTEIKANAFNGCSNLNYVNILAETPATLTTNAFDNTPKNIYVKASKLSAYQSNADWNTLNLKDTYKQTLNTKYATFTHDFPVDFVAANGHDAMEAYVGKSIYKVTQPTKIQKILKMTKATSIAANEGVILAGTPNTTYTYRIAESAVAKLADNKVMPVREDTLLYQTETDGKSNWTLQSDYKLHLTQDAKTIYCGRAYVHETNEPGVQGAKSVVFGLSLDDEDGNMTNDATGIESIDAAGKADEDNVYYTISGVRVVNPTEKGVYIKNGKKVIVR